MQKTFEKNAWHGPSIKEVLPDISPQQSLKKLPNTHSIIELVSHMTSWRVYTTKRLQGDHQFKVTEQLNFPSSSDWSKALQDLDASQAALLQAVTDFPAERLHEVVPNNKQQYTFYTLLHGIIHHDLYHLGQIVLIKKSLT